MTRRLTATDIAQLAICEQQILLDARHGKRRSDWWSEQGGLGRKKHREIENAHQSTTRKIVKIMFLVLLVIVVTILLASIVRESTRITLKPPHGLENATLVAREKLVMRKHPVRLSGRIDEIWRKDGTLFIVDGKSRKARRAYRSDAIQLSVYRHILSGPASPYKGPVSEIAFLRFIGNGEHSFLSIKTMGSEEILALAARYDDVVSKRVDPKGSTAEIICRHCGHRRNCEKARGGHIS